MAPGRVGTTRIFILAVVSLFALLIVHNALNLDLAENASRRPGLLARRAMKASAPAEPPPARRGRAPRAAAPRPAGLGQPPAIAAAARLVDDPPWTTALLPHRAQPFDYSDCSSRPGTLGPTRALEYIVSPDDAAGFPANCEREDLKELCAVVRRVALNREVLTAVCNSNIIGQLEAFLDGVDKAGITNVLIIALDQKLCDWLERRGVAYYRKISAAAGSHKISAQKFRIVKEFLEVGCSVLMSDIDIVWVRNPFKVMWRDTDLEGATDGWDAETAYGWTERLDDVTMGRPAEGYRITAFNSGLWYLQATVGSLRMMTLLAHRMETENTWDQTAFSQEASLGTHDDWLNAGLTVRVMNHLCFCNSKTLLRGIRTNPGLSAHRPVVVHVNYHQSKQAHMVDIHARYHKGEVDALERTAKAEPRGLRSIAQVEERFWTELNDGFVTGSHVQPSVSAVSKHGCAPIPPQNTFLARAPRLRAPDCESGGEQQAALCAKLEQTAKDGEVALVLVSRANARALPQFAEATRLAGVSNVLLVAHDSSADGSFGSGSRGGAGAAAAAADAPSCAARDSALPWVSIESVLPAAALSALPPAALKYALLRQVLRAGVSALLLEPSVVLLTDPFRSLYRDSDVEAMAAGWDEPSAYGYNHVLDDETMGFTRFCHGSRIVGKEPAALFALATADAERLAWVVARRMREAPDTPEREILSEELWLPSSPSVARAGVVTRVANYLCFAHDKVLWRTINRLPALRSKHTPTLVALPADAPDLLQRMAAVIRRYHRREMEALDAFPAGQQMPDFSPEVCEASRHLKPVAGSAEWLAKVTATGWTWSGVKQITFSDDGSLRTPWGVGTWKVVTGKEHMVAATFIGRTHALQFSWKDGRGQFISSRCEDADVVLGRALPASSPE